MTVAKVGGSGLAGTFTGLSSDTKPASNVEGFDTTTAGPTFFETDTKTLFVYNGSAWVITPGVYGGFFQDDLATAITIVTQNVDVIITAMVTGVVSGVTFQNTQELKILYAGDYLINWSCSIQDATGSKEWEVTVGIDGTRQPEAAAHIQSGAGGGTDHCLAGTAILTLAVDELVQLVIRNETDTTDVTIDHANLTLMRIG